MPVTIGNTTITGVGVGGLPAGSVTAATLADSSITADKIGYAGAVLQVVQAVFTGTFSGTSWYSDIGLNLVITPSSSSSKIMIIGNIQIGTSATTAGISLYRNGSQLSGAQGDASSSRPRVTCIQGIGANAWQDPCLAYYLDSPATTSAITYSMRPGSHDQRQWVINRSNQDSDNPDWDNARSISTITA
jgi:hypothetical protein